MHKKDKVLQIIKYLLNPIILIWKYISTKSEVIFPHEGNQKIKLIYTNLSYFMFRKKRFQIQNNYLFGTRPYKESLLRTIVFELINRNIINKEDNIIDIGCWIGDNSIVWAKLLEGGVGKIFSIDPSNSNIDYAKRLSEINGIKNIYWINEVCSNEKGQKIFYQGNINHCDFNTIGIGKKYFKKTETLDSLVQEKNWKKFKLIHIDVEGFEENVLKGAINIISNSLPIIIFEQHLSKDDIENITKHISKYNYKTYMINEVLPDCSLDTRNFISVPYKIDIEFLKKFDPKDIKECWPATIGPSIIEINLL